MQKLMALGGLMIATLFLPLSASAEKIHTKDISNVVAGCGQFKDHPDWCIKFPEGTVNLDIELDDADAAADSDAVFMVMRHNGKHYTYNARTTDPKLRLVEVDVEDALRVPIFVKAPFEGRKFSRPLYLGDHSKLEGMELYVGVGPKGKAISTAKMKQAWANP